jgi:hypothetical protein
MVKQLTFHNNEGIPVHGWNIDKHVGAGAPNDLIDVQLVQFGYLMMSRNPRLVKTPEDMALFNAVKLGAPCTGREDDPLVRLIRHAQKKRGGTQDGVVSPIKSASGDYGNKAYILTTLNSHTQCLMPDAYPRIDQHKDCPPLLKAAVQKSYVVS